MNMISIKLLQKCHVLGTCLTYFMKLVYKMYILVAPTILYEYQKCADLFMQAKSCIKTGNTKGESITALLTSCLTGLD